MLDKLSVAFLIRLSIYSVIKEILENVKDSHDADDDDARAWQYPDIFFENIRAKNDLDGMHRRSDQFLVSLPFHKHHKGFIVLRQVYYIKFVTKLHVEPMLYFPVRLRTETTVIDLISAHFPISAQYDNVWGIGL